MKTKTSEKRKEQLRAAARRLYEKRRAQGLQKVWQKKPSDNPKRD